MKTLIAYTVSLLLLISMSAGVFYQIEGLVTLAVAANWMICILSIPIALIIVVASAIYEKSGEETKVKLAKLLVDAAKKKNRDCSVYWLGDFHCNDMFIRLVWMDSDSHCLCDGITHH